MHLQEVLAREFVADSDNVVIETDERQRLNVTWRDTEPAEFLQYRLFGFRGNADLRL
jgi:hypothetical protein